MRLFPQTLLHPWLHLRFLVSQRPTLVDFVSDSLSFAAILQLSELSSSISDACEACLILRSQFWSFQSHQAESWHWLWLNISLVPFLWFAFWVATALWLFFGLFNSHSDIRDWLHQTPLPEDIFCILSGYSSLWPFSGRNTLHPLHSRMRDKIYCSWFDSTNFL